MVNVNSSVKSGFLLFNVRYILLFILRIFLFIGGFCVVSLPRASNGAPADEVLVVVNTRMSGAKDIAGYYMEKRDIPKNRLLLTSLSLSEVMERDEYEKKLMLPVRKKIEELKGEAPISMVVLIYGVPLKVLPPAPGWDTEDLIQELRKKEKKLRKGKDTAETIEQPSKEITDHIHALAGTDKRAAVDSELMLVKVPEYELSGWIENPYFVGFQGKATKLKKDDVLQVARLDGPDEKTVYRLIDDAQATEKSGLHGTAYFDARWPLPKEKNLSGYALWDASLHRAAAVTARRMKVKLDAESELFAEGAAPNAALYSGWYSLAKYVDSFTWVRGAVGYHIASAECTTLKKQESQVWCMQMLERGVAATIGPVYEPYVQGFPLPELFFAALTEGYMNLGESYLVSLPYISWQMVLVGDPLYRPFAPLEQALETKAHQ